MFIEIFISPLEYLTLMKRIIIDTNFLLIPFAHKVDIFSEFGRICPGYRLYIFEQSIGELGGIFQSQGGKDRKAAKLALKLISLKGISIIKSTEKDVDMLILKGSSKGDIVATQDIMLRKRLLGKGIPVIMLRQKKYLQLVGKGL